MGYDRATHRQKSDVNYRRSERCRDCDFFVTSGACDKVEGRISPEAICDLWTIKSEQSPYRDGEYFQREYEKSEKK